MHSMKFFGHVLYSWILAIAIALAGSFIYELVITNTRLTYELFSRSLLAIGLVAFLVALPSLVIALLFFWFIQMTLYSVLEKFFLWCLAALTSIILNIVFIGLLFAPEMIEPRIFLFLWPAYPAVIISLFVRYRYFLLLHTGAITQEENIV